jgi:hypothetical protein
LVDLGVDVGASQLAGNSGDDGGDWKPLYKKDLIEFFKEKYQRDPTDNDLGKVFEEKFSKLKSKMFDYPLNKNPDIFDDAGDRNTKPDFIGDAKLIGRGAQPNIRIKDAIWVEMKQKGGGVYLSTDDGQIEGHIDNIAAKFAGLKIKYLKYEFRPIFVLITTADVNPSKSIMNHVLQKNIAFMHIHAEFRKTVVGTTAYWTFRFSDII